jgi:hypothetical protein
MAKNVMETEGPQMTSQYGAYSLLAGKARLMHVPRCPDTLHARKLALFIIS